MMSNEEYEAVGKEIIYCEGMCGIDYRYKSCMAEVGIGTNADGSKWATVYVVRSLEPNKGHCKTLMSWLKKRYNDMGHELGSTVALNPKMKHILETLGIKEYA